MEEGGGISAESITNIIVNACIIIGAIYAAVRWMRRWLNAVMVQPLKEMIAGLENKVSENTARIDVTHDIAVEAREAARLANERINYVGRE